jgi:hypothetical protein
LHECGSRRERQDAGRDEEELRVGASGWDYHVPYQDDPAAALRQLQAAVFRDGDFLWRGEWAPERSTMPATVEELWQDESIYESGTHSILDVERVIGSTEPDDTGTVRPLTDEEIVSYLGSVVPTRAAFDRAFQEADGIATLGDRWSGFCTVLYDEGGRPTEWAFWGMSGD